jgi:hypothetical protein
MKMIRNLILTGTLLFLTGIAEVVDVRADRLTIHAGPFRLGRSVSDDAIEAEQISAGTEFLKTGRGIPASNITTHVEQRGVSLPLRPAGGKKLSVEEVAARTRAGASCSRRTEWSRPAII